MNPILAGDLLGVQGHGTTDAETAELPTAAEIGAEGIALEESSPAADFEFLPQSSDESLQTSDLEPSMLEFLTPDPVQVPNVDSQLENGTADSRRKLILAIPNGNSSDALIASTIDSAEAPVTGSEYLVANAQSAGSPEPQTFALSIVGLGILALRRWRWR